MPANQKLIVFPYGITLQERGKIVTVPVAQASFTLKEGDSISLFLVIDSGATISALPQSDAEPLGISIHQGEALAISGISGEPIKGWKHQVPINIGKQTIEIPIAFLESDFCPRVLGRTGVFDRFTIIFEENKQRTTFIKNNALMAKHISEALNQDNI